MSKLTGINLAMQTPMGCLRYTRQSMLRWRMIPSLLYIWRGNSVPKVKVASRLRGFDGGGARAPLQNLSVDEEHELAACLEPPG